MTKLSVIVPFHNVEKYITKCLSSLIHQTLEDIEIILINDASDDSSKEKAEYFAKNDKRIIILNSDELSGQSYCRNLGLGIASGEYIGFVDADDWVELDMFEKMYNRAELSDSDIVMCRSFLFDDREQRIYTDDYYDLKPLEKFKDRCFPPEETKDEILDINVVIWNKIYKKEFLFRNNLKFADGYIYEDLAFFFETYLKAEKIGIVWEKLYYYRRGREYSTMLNYDKKVYDRIPMVERSYNALKQSGFYNEKKTDIIGWIIDDIFHRYTLLEAGYYEEYYNKMKEFFLKIDLTDEDRKKLENSYCYNEFANILKCSYYGFWNYLIEKYKTSNKRIKEAEHKYNLAIKEYVEKDKKEIAEWWENHLCEEKKNLKELFESEKKSLEKYFADEKKKELDEQFEFLEAKKKYDMKQMFDKQQRDFCRWSEDALAEQKKRIVNEYENKLREQNENYQKTLQQVKDYYENEFFLVKIILKSYKIKNQAVNKIKNLLKKN